MLDHTKLESTVRYLGIDADDALKMAEEPEVSSETQAAILVAYRHETAINDKLNSMR